MSYVICGFLLGFVIPYMARRFEKFMPATFGYALVRLLWPVKAAPKAKRKNNRCYERLMKRYVMRSVGWGIIVAALGYLSFYKFGAHYNVWHMVFLWSLLLLTEIDVRMKVLPDIITVPLLISGFLFAAVVGQWTDPLDSAFGAMAGYFVPVFASLFLVWKKPDAFGGGDIKLLAAVGAWMGLEKLLTVIIAACIIFGFYAVVFKKRDGAFGPSIAMAAIGVAFYFL